MAKSEIRLLGRSAFEWTIYIHWDLIVDAIKYSPQAELRNSFWQLSLTLQPGGGWIGIFVHRTDSGAPKTVSYTLRLASRYGDAEITKTHCFDARGSAMSGEPRFLKRDNAWFDIHPTIITFIINSDKPHLLTDKEFVPCAYQTKVRDSVSYSVQKQVPDRASCAIQTQVPDSVSCAIQTQVADRVSCAIQTQVTDSVSCAIQTQVPDSVSCAVQAQVRVGVSCAVQTEDTNSGTEKENTKVEDWTSLDTKGVALLSDRMKDMLMKGNDHDVKICVKDKEFRAHRNILSARSPVFAMMLSHDTKENKTGIISIEDCDPESFHEFLLFVYSGRTENLTPSNALQLYYSADKYDFPVLKEWCVNLLKTSMSVESICDVVLLAVRHQEKELLEVATKFFAQNAKEVLVTVGWINFMSQNPVEANYLFLRSTSSPAVSLPLQ